MRDLRRHSTLTPRRPRRLMTERLEPRMVLAAAPLISEFSAINNDLLADTDGDFSDWIEIYNPDTDPVDLTGWYLTDDAADPTLWQLPSVTIGSDGYLLVFASGKDRAVAGEELHTSFKLDGDGEYLALVEDDGTSVVSAFDPAFPEQRTDITYGLNLQSVVTPLVSSGDTATVLVPTVAGGGNLLGSAWTGGGEPFDDAAWLSGPTGVGFDVAGQDPGIVTIEAIANDIPSGTIGNQDYGGSLGMDFVVTSPVTITELGAFDDGSNGFSRDITVQLWSRNDGGTPNVPAGDTGTAVLASAMFTSANPGTLDGGQRFKPLSAPLVLQAGAYTISAFNYGPGEQNGNVGGGFPAGMIAESGGLLSFVGTSRFGAGGATGFPETVDGGPANRYGAGTFRFEYDGTPDSGEGGIAYQIPEGTAGNQDYGGSLGMDFVVNETVTITQLGAFDSNSDGMQSTITVELWSRDDNNTPALSSDDAGGEIIVSQTFSPGNDGTLDGGSRFKSLLGPLVLTPGAYTISAYGYGAAELNGNSAGFGSLNLGGGALSFVGTSRFGAGGSTGYPETADAGPQNRYGAGTFRFTTSNLLIQTDIEDLMHEVNSSAFLRIPFDVGDPADFDRLRLSMKYDDGFVAYLNGTEIARRNAPETVAWDSTSTIARNENEVRLADVIDVTASLPLLLANATNMLAIQGLNLAIDDGSFVVLPTLEAVELLNIVPQYYDRATPGEANSDGFFGFVADTAFDVDRGFYDTPFDVNITSPTLGATIIYTTDGSDPAAGNGIAVPAADPNTLALATVSVTGTTALRAAAFIDGFRPTNIDTQTYIFIDEVLAQPVLPPGVPSSWGGATGDYEVDPTVVNDPVLGPQMRDALLSLPTISLVLDVDDMFGAGRGIYYNSTASGRAWERPVSIEYFDPNDPQARFQVDAGIRVAGEASRSDSESMKKSFRLYFRGEYGPTKLNFPLFPNSDVTEFDKLQLRAHFGDGWTVPREHPKDSSFVRDMWARRTSLAMGQPAPQGSNVHLYINGLYWGIYNPTERPDEDYAESYFGAVEDGYDVIRPGKALSGDFTAWNQMFAIANAGLADTQSYNQIQEYLDIENLADYMILNIFAYNQDWFGGGKNMFAVRPREPGGQFQFVPWDSEHMLSIIGINRLVNTDLSAAFNTNNTPSRLYTQLRANEEFRIMFADRLQQHLFGDGALTTQAITDQWLELAGEIELALTAESARWGDSKPPYTGVWVGPPEYPAPLWDSPLGPDDVAAEQDRIINEVFPTRTAIVLEQFRALGLYPSIDAATFSQSGSTVPAGFELSASAPAGTIYYTLDGSDPRLPTQSTGTKLVSRSSDVRVLVPSVANGGDQLGDAWHGGEAFDDSSWTLGQGGSGFGFDTAATYDGLIDVDVEAEMSGIVDSVFGRITFDVASQGELDAFDFLTLRMQYDDGFVAFLNGVEIASVNPPATLSWDSAAPGFHDDTLATAYENFDITAFRSLFRVGENVLAIHGLNTDVNGPLVSSDMLISAELVGGTTADQNISPSAIEYSGPIALSNSGAVKARVLDGNVWSAMTNEFFSIESPLRVSEIHYNPDGSDQTEFLEIINTSEAATVDLTGVRLVLESSSEGIEYEFLAGDANLDLSPGQRIVVVRDQAAFAAAYPNVAPDAVAEGVFAGALSNEGETLTLLDADGGVITQFTYDDAWYAATDGGGSSLVIIDPLADVNQWNEASAWRTSYTLGGSPGVEDRLLGDVDGNLRVDLVDAALLQVNMGLDSSAATDGADIDRDGTVTRADAVVLLRFLGSSVPIVAPSAVSPTGSAPAAPAATVRSVPTGPSSSNMLERTVTFRRSQTRQSASRQNKQRRITSVTQVSPTAVDLLLATPTDTIEPALSRLRGLRSSREFRLTNIAQRELL